jgi:nucleoside-diphosphate-sugar epimerase
MAERTVLIAGATGVVGHAALEAFVQAGGWHVVALSRRAPDLHGLPTGARLTHLPVDLTDAQACRTALATVPRITHLAFAALHEQPGLVRGWRAPEQMQTNLRMLRHLLDPLCEAGSLEHVSLLQGTKAYGVHLHPVPVPAQERWPRDAHENFYWLQEDLIRERAAHAGFAFTILRPQLVFGDALGVAMNLVPILGIYAALCRARGEPFSYPGGPSNILEATDARLVGRAMRWSCDAPAARNETFNITNGDVFVWRHLWPDLAQMLGVAPGPDAPRSIAQWLPTQAEAWRDLAARHGLVQPDLSALLGESHHYADFCFGFHAREAPPPVIVSTIKIRQAGFGECMDTSAMFRHWFERLRARRVLPPIG